MPNVIRQDEYATLWYHPGPRVVHHTIHKFIPAGIFQEILTAGAEVLEQNRAAKWLSDDSANPIVRTEDLVWGRTTWGPRVIAAGLKYWAIVPPKQTIGHMQMDQIVKDWSSLGLTIQTFEDATAARAWLAAVDPIGTTLSRPELYAGETSRSVSVSSRPST
jgi:hypothetical protein